MSKIKNIKKLEWEKEVKTRSRNWYRRFPNWPNTEVADPLIEIEKYLVELAKKIDEIIDYLNKKKSGRED